MINKNQNILFIGLGGAGQRHLRIFRELLPENNFYALRKKYKTPLLNSNFTVNNENTISRKYNISELKDEDLIDNIKPILTVISCPTKFHAKYTKLAFRAGSNVLVEKPGFSSKREFDEINNLFMNSELIYQVGFQRIHNPLFIKLKNYIKENNLGKLISGDVNVSSYIPDWHKYENFNELYACRKELGGGVLLTECHEINMMCDLFGEPSNIRIFPKFNKKFNLDVEDTIQINSIFKNANINFDISFLRKSKERKISLIFAKGNLILDLEKNYLSVKNKGEKKLIKSKVDNDENFFSQAKEVIKLINKNKEVLEKQRYFSRFIQTFEENQN
tara:strand:+ start:438 stop:1433 length:996 start_codon:yes stop_codon:yes gene_type:complete